MARKNGEGTEVALLKPNSGVVAVPDYLKGDERIGLDKLGKGDFKIPRIKILDPKSPEVVSFQGKAIPGEFWHSNANVSLGTQFLMAPCVVSKKVILWKPRDEGGGILAYSKDAVKWDTGGNQTFTVKLKGVKEPVKWSTGKSVQASGLLEFGSSNPEEANSAPAATLAYDYLVWLLEYPELSPAVIGVQRTGTPNAKSLNSHLVTVGRAGRPIYSCAVRCFADRVQKGRDTWVVPKFDPAGYVNAETFRLTKDIADKFAEYDIEIEQEDAAPVQTEVKDEIPF